MGFDSQISTNMIWFFPVIFCVSGVCGLSARGGTPDGSEEWGYIPLRPGASMFYWFYRTTHPDGHLSRPVVLWLQGGPGLSGTGIGNFLMFGPLDQNLEPRNSTWIQTANVLIVDNPVSTGFSVADNVSDIPATIEEISTDLITMLKTFMEEHPHYKTNPFHIFGQSYGGKMAAALTYYLHKAIERGEIECNLRGVAIGNGFVSPVDFMVSWAPMMYQMSLIDDVEKRQMSKIAWKAYRAAERGEWEEVLNGWYELTALAHQLVPTLSMYSITDLSRPYMMDVSVELGSVYDIDLDGFMNGAVRRKLGVIPGDKRWNDGSDDTYFAVFQSLDALKPVWKLVDEVLAAGGIDVVVYQGQLDLICDTSGALRWLHKLSWPGMKEFDAARKRTLTDPETGVPEMFVKSHGNLKMFWILNSGHVVPADVPDVALRMLNRIIDRVD